MKSCAAKLKGLNCGILLKGTGALNRAMKRNEKSFLEDFCFQLTEEEFLRCQTGISKTADTTGHGGRRYMPYAFTEQGISMLSAVLHSDVNT
jgi:hypothetical protein